jgi:PEP-CTERM motif
MHGAGLPGVVNFNVVTIDNYGASTGWRAGDGTDLFGGDTSYAIDTNGLVFNSAAWGAGYVFGVYSDGAGGYQDALFGPGGKGNFYSYNVPITFSEVAAQTSGVPEPSTWALMLMGFAGLGYAGFRHGRKESLSRSIA